jgi:molybdate transport system substrate-binding protein
MIGPVLCLAGIVLLAQPLAATEITVLSAGAVQPGLTAAAAAFEKQSGHTFKITYATAPQIAMRIAAGEQFDVVIAPTAVLDGLLQNRKIEERQAVGRVGVGVEVRAGAPMPDISSVEALKRSLLAAESVVFNRASTGAYLETLFRRLGISEEIENKTTRYDDGTAVHAHVLAGRGREIGFGAIPDILLHRSEGLQLVGPLPREVQNYTSYAAAPMAAVANREAARAFVHYLTSPAARALFTVAGIE